MLSQHPVQGGGQRPPHRSHLSTDWTETGCRAAPGGRQAGQGAMRARGPGCGLADPRKALAPTVAQRVSDPHRPTWQHNGF